MSIVKDAQKQYRYFLYSKTQCKERADVESKIGKKFIPGKVLVNGKWYDFTQMSESASNIAYSDSKIVAKGYIENMTYTDCNSEWKGLK